MKREQGLSFIEILAGLAIVAAITIALINGMTTTFKGIEVSQERVAAESLAKSQVEYIKVQDYVFVADYNPGDPANRYETIDIPADLLSAGYSIEISNPQIVTSSNETGFELQSVNVTVKRNAQGKLIITFYKLNA
jgi:type II secretory pathway pseudopilin PulG